MPAFGNKAAPNASTVKSMRTFAFSAETFLSLEFHR